MTRIWKIACVAGVAVAGLLAVFCPSIVNAGGGGPVEGSANAQFRRTVDDSDRSASGKVNFRIHNGRQSATIFINGLGEKDFGIFIGSTSIPDTNSLIGGVGPLDRTNIKQGRWTRRFVRDGGAPLEFDVSNLSDLSGGIILIGKADENLLVQGVTNVVNGVTNILVGIPFVLPGDTNVVGTVLWAPIPPFLTNPSILSFHDTESLSRPEDPAPSPNATGTVRISFDAASGRSVLDVRGQSLIRGQTYTVFIGDVAGPVPNVLVLAGEMEPNKTGGVQQFLRDTKFGDPLPQQARDVVDLSGRIIEIRDAFGDVHLAGTIPGSVQ